MWSQWEEDSSWSDSLLRSIETSFPMMHKEGVSEEQISEKLSIYQVILINTCALSGHNTDLLSGSRQEDRERILFMFYSARLETIGRTLYAICAWHSKANWLN